ncbi:LemA family protein [Aurantimonas sp. HBX-1]|uniref:LemA family protein n=1 Tax=Aurantimonas sp. HBX-1 TaxID=2906072 RepID=UPI00351D377C
MQLADRARPTGARALLTGLALMLLVPLLSACGINAIPTYQEQARAAWAQVENQYQRRSDLIPNLVETVKGFAAQEREVLTAVVEARAKATQTQINADQLTDPAAVQKFQAAQDELSGALSRLLVTVEAYPELRSNQNFLALQSQLEGTENRISVARRDYIEAVRVYNTELRTIPGRWIAAIFYSDAEPMQPFTATAGSATPPTVNFGN